MNAPKTGRPTDYTPERGEEICALIAEGKSMRTVCLREGMPEASTIFRWMRQNEIFRKQYAQACEDRTEAHNEMLLELGEEALYEAHASDPKAAGAMVQAVKLKADNLKWVMSKMKPKKYGDKLDLTSDGKQLPTPILAHVQSNNEPTPNTNVESKS